MVSLLAGLLIEERTAKRSWSQIVVAILASSAGAFIALGVGLLVDHVLHLSNVMLVFLPAVVFSAIRYGFWAATWTVIMSVGLTRYWLAAPIWSFAVEAPAHRGAIFVFVLVAAISSTLAAYIRDLAIEIRRQSRFSQGLYSFTSQLAGASSFQDVARIVAASVRSMLDLDAVVLPPEEAGESPPWVLPLRNEERTLGVLYVRRPPERHGSAVDDERLLATVANQAAMTLERIRLAQQMQDARVQGEADRLRAALLSSVSHDFKTPLASILGNISSVRQYSTMYDEATRDDMLASAQEEAERLSRFVSNLLDMTRIDAGAVQPSFDNVDLSDVVGSAIKSAGNVLRQHWVRVELPPDLPMVRLDCVLMDHLLVNLLDNAAKYSPEGSLICISAGTADGEVQLVVEDEGPGIRAEDLPFVFHRFFRAAPGDRTSSGIGLGLALCRCFAEVMAGSIEAANRTDHVGARFTVHVPVADTLSMEPAAG